MTISKKTLFIFLLISLAFITNAQNDSVIKISANPTFTYQTIDGFGASDAWRCQFVGENWPLSKREQIADLLFSKEMDNEGDPKGIGLSIWRFYISSGTTEQKETSNIGNEWRRGECFQNADGTYNWNKLSGQQWFLKAAKIRGVEQFLAFPNAAPVHLSNNGKGYASKANLHFNLKPGKMKAYASYLVDIIEHFNEVGIPFSYLSPFNEPQWNWDGGNQEGTPALNEELYAFIKYLSHDLNARGLSTKLIIGEAGTIGHIAKIMDNDGRDQQANFFFNPQSAFYIGDIPNVELTISAHSYFSVWPIDKQVEYRKMLHQAILTENPDLAYWQSEYCILQKNDETGGGGGRDLGMTTALYVARIIHNDLTLSNAKSWQWWTALSQVDYKDGLVYLDDGNEGITGKMGSGIESLKYDGKVRDSKLLWILGNYSRFVRPGMQRIACSPSIIGTEKDGLLISAYKEPHKPDLVYVMVNLSKEIKTVQLDTTKEISMYITSETNNLSKFQCEPRHIEIPGRAVVTLIVK